MKLISLYSLWFFLQVLALMQLRNPQHRRMIFSPSHLDTFSQCLLWNERPSASSSVFYVFWAIFWALLLSILKIVSSIIYGDCPHFIALMRFLLRSWMSKVFLGYVRYLFLISFLLCPLPIFPSIRNFPFLKSCPGSRCCRIYQLHLYTGVRHPPTNVLDMTLSNLKVRFKWYRDLGNAEHPFIAISPRSTLARKCSTW